ncbi:MAG: HDIG domain-containing protein [Spirochaetota bacterium]|nr:HDIG domain-containing protein [Spirochaetota bacterium]
MQNNKIPTPEECHKIMKNNNMLQNIVEHSEQVTKVAVAIIDNLNDNIKIEKDVVIAASLLHDITKTRAINTKEPHDITGAQELRKLGLNTIADIVEEHVTLKNFDMNGLLEEKEIVYYADKRVMHSTIVSIDERIEDIISRYAFNPAMRDQIYLRNGVTLQLEEKISACMKRDIDEVIDEIS